MKKSPSFGVLVALLFSAALLQTAAAQNIGTALVNGAPQINSGTVDGNVQQMTGVNATLNSGAVITGDLLVPGTPTLIKNGQYTFGGTIVGTGSTSPSNYQVILNGSVRLGHLRTRTNPVAIPAWPPVPSPTGTRTVTITAAGQSAGSFATLRNFTLNGNVGQYAVPPGTYGDFIANGGAGFTLGVAGSTQPAIYNLQHLTLNGATKLLVVGPVILNVANGFTANGTAGTSANPAWLKLNIVTGGFTVNGGCTLYGYATAPNGTLIINGAAKLIGGASCNALTVNANGLLQLFDATSFENKPPTVAITNPAAGTVFNVGNAITLTASATDTDGSVSKVEFFAGATKLGEATSSPWTYAWQNAAAGSYQLTAIATDNLGAKTTSVAVPIRVNTPPTVALTAPANQSVFPPGGVITLTANAADSDGTIQKVEFFSDGTKLGEKTSIPYSFSWNGAATGPHALTAKATDNNGAQTVSATVNIRVNAAPSATMTAPANGSVVQAGSVIPLAANASDSDGTIAKVEFYAGATKVGEDTTAPYQFNWSNAAAGHYSLTARAIDNDGAQGTSAPINLTINAPPAVAITAPAAAQVFNSGATISITANPSDPDGTVMKVEFFSGATKIGEASAAPWTISWPAPAPGLYQLSAVATDDLGAQATSAVVSVRINAPPTVTITSPADQAVVQPGNPIPLTANASDSDGTITKVEFFAGGTKLGESSSAPFNFSWSNAISGSYTITAKATDNAAASAVSAPIHLRVNALPVVALTAPAQGATYRAGDAIPISANASDSDDGITKVEFFAGGAKIGEASAAPYSVNWTGAPEGASTLTARATDGSGASATSAAVTINVTRINTQLTVDAGPDRLISLPGGATLEGQVLSNGGTPGPEVALQWSLVSGPGAVTFSAPNSSATSASFAQDGNYIIRLTASNADGANFDTTAVTVLSAPQPDPDSFVSNRGREFWMAFLSNPAGSEPAYAGGNLNITSETAATGTVEIFNSVVIDGNLQVSREVKTFSVAAGGKTVVDVTTGFAPDYRGEYDQVRPSAIHIVADAPVAVHALNYMHASTDGSLILPTSLLGLDHFIMSYRNGETSPRVGTELAIVATKPQTLVTITPTSATGSHPAGQPFTVTLQTGDVFRLISMHDGEDLTGSRVQADKPVAVFGGHSLAYVPYNVPYADHLYEQIPSVDLWGRHFVTIPLKGRTGGDLFRALASDDNTHVSINGEIVATLNRGQFYETVLTQPAYILADQHILLAQFAQGTELDHTTGDPFLSIVPPYETFGRHYIMPTPYYRNYDFTHNTYVVSDIYDSYLSLIVDSAHAGAVTVNGQTIDSAQFFPIADSGFSGASIAVPKNSTLDISSPTPVGTLLYGWAPFESYGYTGGLYGAMDNASAQLQLTQSSAAAPVGSTHRVTASLLGVTGLPVPDALVTFSVTGANPTTGSGLTSPDGTVEFSWQGAQAGTDTVTATTGALTATAVVTWLSNVSNQPPQVNAGPDAIVKLGETVPLNGLAQDDGLPANGQLTVQWSVLPGSSDFVAFSNPNSAQTSATFAMPGQYRLRFTAFDGQFSGDDDLLVIVDAAPRFELFTPSGNTIDAGSQWSIDVIGSDPDGVVAKVELLEGAQVVASVQPNQIRTSRITFSVVLSTAGSHTMTVRLTDDLGITTDQSIVVNARPAPVVQILTPASNISIAAGDSVTFTASASSAGGAITQLIYQDVTYNPFEIGEGTGTNYSLTWTPDYAGTFQIAATAYDSAGASGTSAPVTITVQSPGDPTITITSPGGGSSFYPGQSATVHADASAVSPAMVDGVNFYDGNNYLGSKYSPPYEVQWFAGYNGAHSLSAEVYDSFGGYSSTSITVNVIEPPDLTVTLVQPPPNIPVKVNAPTTLAATVDGVIGTFDGAQFFVNGQLIGDGESSSVTWTPTAVGNYEIEVDTSASNPRQFGYVVTNLIVADLHSPLVQFTAPTNNSTSPPSAPIVLQAQASDIDTNLSKLQFFADGQLLSETPLSGGAGVASFIWDNAGPGWHSLIALALDDTNQSGSTLLRAFVQRSVANSLVPATNLTATSTSAVVTLSWIAPANSGSIQGYIIERKLGRQGVWEEIDTSEPDAPTYEDAKVDSQTYYVYRVASLNETGAISSYSNEAIAITRAEVSQYLVVDLGDSLQASGVAAAFLSGPESLKTAYANIGDWTQLTPPPIDVGTSKAMSISDDGQILLAGVDGSGREIAGKYLLWRPDGEPYSHLEDKFTAVRITKDGTVVGSIDKTHDHSGVTISETHGVYWPKDLWANPSAQPIDITPSPAAYAVTKFAEDVDVDWLLTHLNADSSRTWWTAGDPNAIGKQPWELVWRSRLADRNRAGVMTGEATIVGQSQRWSQWQSLALTDPYQAAASAPFTDAGSSLLWPNGAQTPPQWSYLFNGVTIAAEATAFALNDSGAGVGVMAFNTSAINYHDRFGDNLDRSHAIRSNGAQSGQQFDDLGTLGDGRFSGALEINNNGVAVGYSTLHKADEINHTQAVAWQADAMSPVQLPSLLGSNTSYPDGYGYAYSINDKGQVVGQSLAINFGDDAAQVPAISAAALWIKNAANDPTVPVDLQSAQWEVADLNTQIDAFATEDLGNGQTITYCKWHLDNAVGVNKDGWIVGTGLRTRYDPNTNSLISESRSFLLLPLELKDIKGSGEADDVVIQTQLQQQQDPTPASIAWIEPHLVQDNGPQMPQLEARFTGAMNVEWKLDVKYDRGNGQRVSRNQPEDIITIPATGFVSQSTTQPWRIYQEADWTSQINNNGFFGGSATLTVRPQGQREQRFYFRIGGKSPDNVLARHFVDAQATPQEWFSYAIAKHETGEYRYAGSLYNQFRSKPKAGQVGLPTWNLESGPGGYGIFQITGSPTNSDSNIPRRQIWNWQDNGHAYFAILRHPSKSGLARRFYADLQNNSPRYAAAFAACPPPDIPVGNHVFSSSEAIWITAYNGWGPPASPYPLRARYVFDPNKPCGLGQSNRWFWNPPLNPDEHYIDKIEREIDP